MLIKEIQQCIPQFHCGILMSIALPAFLRLPLASLCTPITTTDKASVRRVVAGR